MIQQLQSLFRFRLLVGSLVGRELKARYRGSVLGFFWSFINPLMLVLTYGLIFTYMWPAARGPETEPYFLFLFCGILPWTWFSASLMESTGVLVAGGNLIKKVLFPAEVLPVVTVLANLLHFLLGLPILILFLVLKGHLSWTALLLPVPIAVQLLLTLGLALLVSSLSVYFRDIQNILTHVIQIWFFATPVLYPYSQPGGLMHTLLRFNPMTHVLVGYQDLLFYGVLPPWKGLLGAVGFGLVAFTLGAFVFDRLRDTLPEEV